MDYFVGIALGQSVESKTSNFGNMRSTNSISSLRLYNGAKKHHIERTYQMPKKNTNEEKPVEVVETTEKSDLKDEKTTSKKTPAKPKKTKTKEVITDKENTKDKKTKTKDKKTEKETAKNKKTKEEIPQEVQDVSKETTYLTYKGKPLVRKGNEIYYGNMSDKYVIMFLIKNTKKIDTFDASDDITVQLMYTDPEIKLQDRIVKKSEKQGIYPALDIAHIWLERYLKNG